MTPMELIPLLDKGMVEELRMYYNGRHTVIDISNIPEALPGYQIAKMWNSENGKGISVLLADNMAENPDDNECKCDSCKWMGLPIFRYPCCFCGRSSNWCKFEPKFMAEDPEAKTMHVEEYRDKLIEVFHKSGHDELIALVPQAKNDEIEIMEQILKDWPCPPYNSNKGGK